MRKTVNERKSKNVCHFKKIVCCRDIYLSTYIKCHLWIGILTIKSTLESVYELYKFCHCSDVIGRRFLSNFKPLLNTILPKCSPKTVIKTPNLSLWSYELPRSNEKKWPFPENFLPCYQEILVSVWDVSECDWKWDSLLFDFDLNSSTAKWVKFPRKTIHLDVYLSKSLSIDVRYLNACFEHKRSEME